MMRERYAQQDAVVLNSLPVSIFPRLIFTFRCLDPVPQRAEFSHRKEDYY